MTSVMKILHCIAKVGKGAFLKVRFYVEFGLEQITDNTVDPCQIPATCLQVAGFVVARLHVQVLLVLQIGFILFMKDVH